LIRRNRAAPHPAMASENTKNGLTPISTISDLPGEVLCVKFNPSATRVAVALSNGFVRIYNAGGANAMVAQLSPPQQNATASNPSTASPSCTCLKFLHSAASQNLMLAAYTSGDVLLWHTTSNKVLRTYTSSACVLCLDVRPDGKEYAIAGESEDVEVIDMATNTLKCSLGIGGLRVSTSTTGPPRSHSSRIFSVLYHPTDPHTIVSAGWDRTVQVWDTRKSEPVRHISNVFVCGDGLAMDKVTGTLLTGSYREEKTLQTWDFATLKEGKMLSNKLEPCWVYCCEYANDDNKLVGFVGAKKNEARLMDATTSVTIGRYTDERALYSLDFSHNDALMVVGGAGRSVTLLAVNRDGMAQTELYAPTEMEEWTSVGPPMELMAEVETADLGDMDPSDDDSDGD